LIDIGANNLYTIKRIMALMWGKLECHYGDTTASVQAALENLQRLKPVKEEDYKALVELVDEV
jgi:hypothetical protein